MLSKIDNKRKQFISTMLSLCLLFSLFCFTKVETGFFCEQKSLGTKKTSLSAEFLPTTEDIHIQKNIRESEGNNTSHLYSKNKKSNSNNRRIILLGFASNKVTSLFILFYILNMVNFDNKNLSIINILHFIHDKDGKK
ncbi:hypothetical protein SAMN02745111_02324 [Eubacterium uniforme]|uniref:Uncharacterized protein n=1 Tax=Eubacterium uniforme TaxID=39495 RepID=A0A1T4W4X2_9FIRM|nr:hypothetical protein [Eubacterium uniforme]SKA72292.1 hypothetical protein SAMN02745111_02324 [Eubacterium uniforme]